jgi:hypothetical protein
MLKKMLFAVVPMLLLATAAHADDDLLAGLDANSIQDADITIESASLDVDFESVADNTDSEDAVEACFRRFGYRGWGYRNYSCYRPYYNVCYQTYYSYRPVFYQACYPVYRSYWGCY